MRSAKVGFVGVGVITLGLVAASPALAATSGTEHFTLVNTATANNPPPQPISASGPIHALGHDKVLSGTKDRFNFPKGSIIVVHTAKHDSHSADLGSCTFRFTESGTYTVTGGSGLYAHASGSGTYSLTGIEIGCSMHKPPTAASVIINASGPLSY